MITIKAKNLDYDFKDERYVDNGEQQNFSIKKISKEHKDVILNIGLNNIVVSVDELCNMLVSISNQEQLDVEEVILNKEKLATPVMPV